MPSNSVSRIRTISFLLVAAAFVLVVRLYFVQIVDGGLFAKLGQAQYVQTSSNVFDRGSIFFSDKSGELISAATLASGFSLTIDPELITDPEGLYQKLSTIVTLDHTQF